MKRVLIVDDEVTIRMALQAQFRNCGWVAFVASGVQEGLATFESTRPEVVITDVRMLDGNGIALMQQIRSIAPETRVILLTAFGSVPDAVTTMKQGASDYLIKPVSFEQLRRLVEGEEQPARNRDTQARREVIHTSEAMAVLYERAARVAPTEMDILIEAESGTGKEVLARYIHERSSRREKPFVAVNCAALPEALLESELFGHIKGAFTGATQSRAGKFELAQGGTLLLDEIGEMPISLQPKLLRALQEREIDRLGDIRPTKIDVRVIATTNRSLLQLVHERRFRADLFYRLNVIPMSIPPLRERKDDIRALADYFLRKYAPAGRPAATMTEDFLASLAQHDWPGNVRELENFIRRCLALSPGTLIDSTCADALPPAPVAAPVLVPAQADDKISVAIASGASMKDLERRVLETTLRANGGNRTRTAEVLGISLRTVRNKIREYNLPRKHA